MVSKKYFLVAISSHSPFEQAIIDALISDGLHPIVLDVQRGLLRIHGQKDLFSLNFFQTNMSGFFYRREVAHFLEETPVERALAIGLAAGIALAQLLPASVNRDIVIMSSDISFSKRRRPEKFRQFNQVLMHYQRLFFDNQYLFTAAIEKGSKIPHFLLDINPRDTAQGKDILDAGALGIGLIRSPEISDDQCLNVIDTIRRKLPGRYVRVIEDNALFGPKDAEQGRSLCDVMQGQLQGLSALVFLGCSQNTQVVLRSLSIQDSKQCVVMDNFQLRNALWDIGAEITLCPTYKIVDALKSKTESTALRFQGGGSILDQLTAAQSRDVPAFYEDFLALRQDGPLDIYFSVNPVELHSHGARAQRIRNMLLGMRHNGRAVVDVSSIEVVLLRRMQLIEAEFAKGRSAGIFYGENSTSPISSFATLSYLEALIGLVRARKGKTGWFIRDLHFMDKEVWNSGNEDVLIDRARQEFSILSESIDVFYAPTPAAIQKFRSLLPACSRQDVQWRALPPGMLQLAAPPIQARSRKRLAFVYSGGLGPIYRMDSYLQTVTALCNAEDVSFDFVVREAEKEHLSEIADQSPNIRIITNDFDNYISDAQNVVGVSLLETGYADLAFPLKIMNYAARSIPVLCFDTAVYADFIRDSQIGWVVEKTPHSVLAKMQGLITQARAENAPLVPFERFQTVWNDNSWKMRAQTVLQ